jgi:hypothetical protein
VKLWFSVLILLAGSLDGQTAFCPANYTALGQKRELRVFPTDGPATAIKIPFSLATVKFAGDGRSLYASLASALEHNLGLVRIDFNPVRSTPLTGTRGFGIRDFAVSQDNRKIVVSGSHREEGKTKCGLFEIQLSGEARHVLAADCDYRWSWTDLTLSPESTRAIASFGNTHTDHNYRLDLIDLVRGTTTSLGDLDRATWSPDGKWVAAIEWSRKRLILLDANDPSRRRDLGSTVSATWSPDSRYLLLWKWHLLRCGIGIDIEPPASLEVLEVASGKRSLVRSSQCQLVTGPIGWVARNISE